MEVNKSCPGTESENAGKADGCAGCPGQKYCSTGLPLPVDPDLALIADNLKNVKNILVVLSGKGGVGKSLTAMMISRTLAEDEDLNIGLLDIDICGPSVPLMTKQQDASIHNTNAGWVPVYIDDNFSLMSAGFLIGDKNQAVIWRGSKKTALIKQFLKDTDWGELDYLIIDAPPGTSDEHLTLVQSLKSYAGNLQSVIVTTSSALSIADVRREITFCEKSNLGVLGIIENMAGYQCPHCGKDSDIFNAHSGDSSEKLCEDRNLPKLAKLPLNPFIAHLIDTGENPYEPEFKVPKCALDLYKHMVQKITSLLPN